MSFPGPHAPEGQPYPQGPVGKCPHCGGEVVPGLAVNQNAEVGAIGLSYKTRFLFIGTEQLRADLCRTCGTVVRLFVKETNRNWVP